MKDSPLPLTCRPDTGFPNEVSCSGSAWFVQGYSNFREDLSVDGLLPYGQVHCCTPDERVVEAVHVKCGARENVQNCAYMRHTPSSLSSFLSGFSLSLNIDTEFAPEGSAVCCDAIAETKGGKRYYLSPCECVATKEVMCPNATDALGVDRVMTGFLTVTSIGVPLTPVECCSMCLAEEVRDDSDCSRYDHCNGNGVCHSGFCECTNGFSGIDCSFKVTLTLVDLFRGYLVELVLCSMSGAIVLMWCFFFVRRARRVSGGGGFDGAPRRGRGGSDREEALLDYGELEDTESDSSESDESDSDAGAGAGSGAMAAEDGESGPMQRELKDVNASGGLTSSLLGKGKGDSCAICMSSSKLVVLVPCGHTSICKKCSKRVDFCPFCRAQIYRRQKIYMPA